MDAKLEAKIEEQRQRMQELMAPQEAVSDQQVTAVTARLQAVHAAQLLSDDELFAVEDGIAGMLDVIKDHEIGWPRGENDEEIFTAGNARPLDEATQNATTEMLRWLVQDYGLDPLGANLLLAQCVRYDLGNMFDPAYTMVCKVPREFLPAPTTSGG